MRWILPFLCFLLPVALAQELDVPASGDWVDTNIDVRAGDSVQISASGTLKHPQSKTAGPEGASRSFRDLIKSYPVNAAGLGALIGRIGSAETATPFLVGASKRLEVPRSGRLFLGINKTRLDGLDGSFHVKIQFNSRGPEVSSTPANIKVPEVTVAMIDRVPRRVNDAQGNAGDNTNFVVVGPEKKVLQAFAAAGWVQVDKDVKDAVFQSILATITKQAYVTMPMSILMLFDRPQDYGLAHAEPLAVVAQRHHLRLWKAPFKVEDQELWVGAATHDIGFEKDQRNNGVTHKIDPEIDKEREFVAASLQETGLVAKASYVMPSQPSKEARTATGGTIKSDGRLLVLNLVPDNIANASGPTFANLFCTVREKENPDGGNWDGCDKYLEGASNSKLDLPEVSTKYRVLVVPGFFSACASSTAPAYKEGLDHLSQKHMVGVETWVPPNASSEDNAKAFAQYIRDHMVQDKRKYIVIGYSKGAPDVQTAIAKEDGVKDAVAAFVSVAGAIGGSAIADALPAQANQYMQRFKLGECTGDVSAAFNSLRRDVRRAFLAQYPNPLVPSYSLPTVADLNNVSKGLQESWRLVSVFSNRQDSQLTEDDSIIPGSKVLGTAKADHLAVALPFDKATDSAVRAMADKGKYPRAALLEAIVRFVSSDLESH
jgi:hypothetical protein